VETASKMSHIEPPWGQSIFRFDINTINGGGKKGGDEGYLFLLRIAEGKARGGEYLCGLEIKRFYWF
jgi:hypothetical protein